MKSNWKRVIGTLLSGILTASVVTAVTPATVKAATAAENPKEVMIGAFFTSQTDTTDTVYVSFDGETFYKVAAPFVDAAPNDPSSMKAVTTKEDYDPHAQMTHDWLSCLHDPGIQYHDGTFWMMSGYTSGGKYYSMFAASPDLIHWAYPMGSQSPSTPAVLPLDRNRQNANTDFDVAAGDFMVDDDGTVWVVACFGYYGDFHGEAEHDYMTPYLIRYDGVNIKQYGHIDLNPKDYTQQKPGTVPTDFCTKNIEGYHDIKASAAYPINLDQIGIADDLKPEANGQEWIDASLFKQNGTYYLSIKKDGIQNQIWKTDHLGADSKWALVCQETVRGYEGPSLTYFQGRYRTYVDRLANYDPYRNRTDLGVTGINVVTSDSLSGGWTAPHPIKTVDVNGNVIPNRHGSVYTITDPEVISKVMDAYWAAGYTEIGNTVSPSEGFTDVSSTAFYHDAVYWAVQNGITSGVGNNQFGPGQPCTRAQAMTFLYKAAGAPNTVSGATFVDVAAGKFYEKPVQWAVGNGITSGTSATTFSPNATCTRAQIVTFLHKFAKMPAATIANPFTDVPAGKFYTDPVIWAVQNGITGGTSATTFSPSAPCTRAQIVTFLYKHLHK